MSNKPPIEVPQGAIRLNTDSQRLEFFAQDRWYEFATNSPTLDGGSRGFWLAGSFPPAAKPRPPPSRFGELVANSYHRSCAKNSNF